MPSSGFKHWLLPAALGGGLFAAGLWFVGGAVRLPKPTQPATSLPTAPNVLIAAKSDVNRELAVLTDLEPLFLPTPWNTSILELPAQSGREPRSMTFTFPAKWTVPEAGGGVTLPDAIAVPTEPLNVLRFGDFPNPMPEVGRADVALPDLPGRVAYMEVRKARSGALVFAETITAALDAKRLTGEWTPLEYMVAVDSGGLVGEPQVIRPGGADDVEAYFRGVLMKQLQLGARLPPGFYTVAVGP